MALERVPLWRRAGAGLALPVFNKDVRSTFNLFPSEARRDFSRLPIGSRFVLADYLRGLFVRGFPYPSGLRASGALGNYATLSGLVSFGFLVLLVLFFVSHLLRFLCVKVGLFF